MGLTFEKVNITPELVRLKYWTLSYNYLFPILTKGIGRVFESGLGNRWESFHLTLFEYRGKEFVRKSLKDFSKKHVLSQDEHAVSRSAYLEILIQFWVLIIIAVTVFIFEVTQKFNLRSLRYRIR